MSPTQSAILSRVPEQDSAARRPESSDTDPLFLSRWSRRALSPEPIPAATLAALFDAARFAPSASNVQPWLFVYADEPHALARLRPLVNERNRRWADRAPVLVLLFAQRHRPDSRDPLRTCAFDTGAAWMSLALQAERLGLAVRAMGGINLEATYEAAGVSRADYEIMCAIAIGQRSEVSELPADLHDKERPSTRKALSEVVRKLI